MATHETRAALVEATFGFGARAASEELEAKAMVVARPGLGHVCAMRLCLTKENHPSVVE